MIQDSTTAEQLWESQGQALRDPNLVLGQFWETPNLSSKCFEYEIDGPWWELLSKLNVTLFITREYEHLIMAMTIHEDCPRISWQVLPHPNGMIAHPSKDLLHIASTRNPNLIYDFVPSKSEKWPGTLIPQNCSFFPGRLYMHDLGYIDHRLHANAVGMNAVIEIHENGSYQPVWWPNCINTPSGPNFDVNYLQLNSIASGNSILDCYFSASCSKPGEYKPGDFHFPVDKQGVLFSGKTREVIATGLTRPHSARIIESQIWVDNSGYGEVGYIESGRFVPFIQLPGWTRGLWSSGDILIVGSSRVLPRFHHYAPGLDPDRCKVGIHMISKSQAKLLASLYWPYGNQIFAIESLPATVTNGFILNTKSTLEEVKMFYSQAHT